MEYWLLFIINFLVYSTFSPYFSNESLMLQSRFEFDTITAGRLIAAASGVLIVSLPFIGFAFDYLNVRGWQLIGSCILLICANAILIAMPNCYQCLFVLLPLTMY